MAASLVTVTLVRAWNPGDAPSHSASIAFAAALDAQGRPDLAAWLADPDPWPARRSEGVEEEDGDVAHDETGWQLRFPADPDAPAHRLHDPGLGFRPGVMVTLQDPEGRESAWRVVGLA